MRNKAVPSAFTSRVRSRRIASALALIALIFVTFGHKASFADAPPGYYKSAENLHGEQLKLALHDVIKDHTVVSYDSLWTHYEKTDVRPDGKPWCIYSDYPFQTFNPKQGGPPGKIGSFLTREHSWPKDWWGGTRNAAYSDLFNVLLGDAHVNGQKGIKPLGETAPGATVFAISKVGQAATGLGYDGQVFEPADQYKGDFARGYLYFAVRYLAGPDALNCAASPMVEADGHTLKPWAIRLLEKWNLQDPVSERETLRNDAVFKIQHNRNPFIDHPEYAEAVWNGQVPPINGVDANYSLEMERAGQAWSADAGKEDLLGLLRRKGCDGLRIRLWTKDDGPYGLKYATELALRGQQAGLKPHLALFLSEDWADFVKQPVPAAWKKLSLEEKQTAVRAYSERVIRHFQDAGVKLETIAIGNEIDFGICGEFETDWPKRVSLPYMKEKIWPRMAAIIRAAQEGVLKAQPKARFLLHLAQWDNPAYATAFFKFMTENGVQLDELGLSYYPSAAAGDKTAMDYFLTHAKSLCAELNRPLTVCEYAYPSAPKFPGQFSTWNHPAPGYPLDPVGQQAWLRDFLKQMRTQPYVRATYYWSPEWYKSDMWPAFTLFDEKGVAKPALNSLTVH